MKILACTCNVQANRRATSPTMKPWPTWRRLRSTWCLLERKKEIKKERKVVEVVELGGGIAGYKRRDWSVLGTYSRSQACQEEEMYLALEAFRGKCS